MATVDKSQTHTAASVTLTTRAPSERDLVGGMDVRRMLQGRTEVRERRQRRVRRIGFVTTVAPAATALAALSYAMATGRWDIGLWAMLPAAVSLLNLVALWWTRKRLAPARHLICWSTLIGLGLSTFFFGISFGVMAAFMAWAILLFAILQSPRMAFVPAVLTIATVIAAAILELVGLIPIIPLDPWANYIGNITIGLIFPLALLGTVHAYADYILDVLRGLGEVVREETQVLVESNQHVATSMQQQAAAVQEISATAEQLARTAEQLRAHSHQLNAVVQEAERTAQQGGELIDTVLQRLSDISQSIQNLAQDLVRLSSASQRIQEIVETIQRVSDDTHLIALNASIEAASASEHGRRFGAIAAEMRRLSQNVLEASEEVRRLVPDLQEGLQRITLTLEAEVQEAKEVGQKVHAARSQVQQMVEGFHDIALAAQELQTVADELATVSDQIRLSLNDLAQVTHRLTETTQQTAVTTQKLDALVAVIPKLGQ